MKESAGPQSLNEAQARAARFGAAGLDPCDRRAPRDRGRRHRRDGDARSPRRERFVTELTLDPPSRSGDLSGAPLVDEDYLCTSR